MHEHQPSGKVVLTEAQFRAVFELATRATPVEEGIPLARVREIAAELGIPEDAILGAVREVMARDSEQQATVPTSPRPAMRRAVLMAATACATGVAAALIASAKLDRVIDGVAVRMGSGAFVDVPVALFLIGMTLVNLRSRRRARRMDLFLVEAVATWLAFGVGMSVANWEVTDDLITFVTSMIGGSAVLGWLTTKPWKGLFRRGQAVDAAAPAASKRVDGYQGNVVERRRELAVAQ